MPAKNELKLYVANGYYHLYNRGVVEDEDIEEASEEIRIDE